MHTQIKIVTPEEIRRRQVCILEAVLLGATAISPCRYGPAASVPDAPCCLST